MKPVKPPVSYSHALDPRTRPQPEVPRHRARKDTRRWCRGVVGRRHLCAWEFSWPTYSDPAKRAAYPTVLQLVCTRPGCNKVVSESWRNDYDWPDKWSSRHDTTGRRAFYGPGLPPDGNWGRAVAPSYVDVIGAPS